MYSMREQMDIRRDDTLRFGNSFPSLTSAVNATLPWIPSPETLLTVALSMIIADVSLAIWGGHPLTLNVPAYLNPRVTIFVFFVDH